jgi:hypothetical protein
MKMLIAVIVSLMLSPVLVNAQSVEEELRALRAEIQRLRQEVDSLRLEVRGRTDEPSPAEMVPVLQAQVQEHAQTKVESVSKFPMKLFGTILSETAWNSGEPNWLDLPNVAAPYLSQSSGSFTSTLRQSRVGGSIDGPDIGTMKSRAYFAMDFFGGIPNFATGQVMGLPRMLYAYARLDGDRNAFQVGQDHMIFAPNNPTSLGADSFPLFYRSGNLYLRVPQIRAERVLHAGPRGEVRVIGGIVAPVAGDFVNRDYEFVPPALAGERSRMPGLQARIVWRARPEDPYTKPAWEFGTSGHYSQERLLTPAVQRIPSWATAFDFNATAGRLGTGGELFVGRNVDAFGGSVAQIAKSYGGFIEGRVSATERLSFNGGYGTDRLFDSSRFLVSFSRNSSAFGNAIYRFTPEFGTSVEYRWLGTKAFTPEGRWNHHLNLIFAYSF